MIAQLQTMVYAVCRRILRERSDALDATQDTFARAFWRLHRLEDPAAFAGYLRRTAIHCAHDVRRKRRATFAPLALADSVPVLDEHEHTWTVEQRAQLGRALLKLTPEERRITERFYHGAWSTARLAQDAGISESALRKRLERIRNKLRWEVEMNEQQTTRDETLPSDLPVRLVDLLARPRLVDLPDNPVARVVELLRNQFTDYTLLETPEIVDLANARARLECDPVYVPADKLFYAGAAQERVLRYDLSLPLWLELNRRDLLTVPVRVLTTGKVYRNEIESVTHLSAFHQLELLHLDEHARVDAWAFISRALAALDAVVPNVVQRVSPSQYPFCTRAWDLGVEVQGEYSELLGCGVYRDDVVRLLGGDPTRHTAIGLGIGLERLAMLHFGVSDIRAIDSMRL